MDGRQFTMKESQAIINTILDTKIEMMTPEQAVLRIYGLINKSHTPMKNPDKTYSINKKEE